MRTLAFLLLVMTITTGCAFAAPPAVDLDTKLRSFAKEKEVQARSLVKEHLKPISPMVWEFFRAAQAGDWPAVTNLYHKLENLSGQREWSKVDHSVAGPVWSTVLEVGLTVELYLNFTPRFTALLAHDLNSGLPRGSVIFGGTDPGRCFPTAFCASHVRGDPYFTLTQNALADASYLSYLRATYGDKLKMLSNEDSGRCFTEYVSDATRRLDHDERNPAGPRQIKPGELITRDPATRGVKVSGQVPVMMINGLMVKAIFDGNPTREFFVEESYPLDWMYPHLTPHGAILKINRAPVTELTAETIAKDRAFWSERVRQFLGTDFAAPATVKEVCEFVDRVYARRDLSAFKGDRRFLNNPYTQTSYSKLRSAIAGTYFWRINEAGRRANLVDQQRMIAEADRAFLQAFALDPSSPEVLFRYANLLISLGRLDDTLLITQTALKFEPENSSFKSLLDQVNALRAMPPKQPNPIEAAFRANPTNVQAGLQLVSAHVQLGKTNDALAVLDSLIQNSGSNAVALVQVAQAYGQLGQKDKAELTVDRLRPLADQILANPQSDAVQLQAALQAYQMAGNVLRMEECLSRLVKLNPASPELWYDLGAILAFQQKTNAALSAVSNAVHHSDIRLRQNPASQNLRSMATTDGRFKAIRPHPDFKRIVTPEP
jgi:tetratricopeptide (TPR) repeat protein